MKHRAGGRDYHMKKRLALLLAAVLTLTAVTAGCGSKEETENKSADESSEAKTEYVQKDCLLYTSRCV